MCWGLDRKADKTLQGQIAHVDRDSSNSSPQNGAYLCLPHHDTYDSTPSQSCKVREAELRTWQGEVMKYVSESRERGVAPNASIRRTRTRGVSLDVYDRRLPIYSRTMDFIRQMCQGPQDKDSQRDLFQFAADTELALFLYDDKIAEYLVTLYRNAVELRMFQKLIESRPGQAHEYSEKEMRLMLWFTEQFNEARAQFVPYLRIKS